MIVLCTHSLHASRAVDLMDVTRAHHLCITRRNGEWELTPDPRRETGCPDDTLGAYPGHSPVTTS
jgi:hypothetical protein